MVAVKAGLEDTGSRGSDKEGSIAEASSRGSDKGRPGAEAHISKNIAGKSNWGTLDLAQCSPVTKRSSIRHGSEQETRR